MNLFVSQLNIALHFMYFIIYNTFLPNITLLYDAVV